MINISYSNKYGFGSSSFLSFEKISNHQLLPLLTMYFYSHETQKPILMYFQMDRNGSIRACANTFGVANHIICLSICLSRNQFIKLLLTKDLSKQIIIMAELIGFQNESFRWCYSKIKLCIILTDYRMNLI